ncbi:MAG: hypothetical protein HRU48_23280 [Vibrio sp.]|uniref:hypothetical protein n=1 Tax=Vibrio sp. TaxID=678 RepID=UPI001ED0B8AE|nr:hypothetical protein [Vibrio sp.]NRB70234.1 hypothetical protein [Vibrio sp.]
MFGFGIVAIGLIGLLGAWLLSCIVIVGPREGRIIQVFGGSVAKSITTQGIHFKLPDPSTPFRVKSRYLNMRFLKR